MPEGTDLTPRAIVPSVLEELAASRAVGLIGSRQVGKTTLARHLLGTRYPAVYVTMDDDLIRASATFDPLGFIAGLTGPTIIDEIQRAPALMLALKQRLDTDDRRGQFLITGSANIAALPTIRDALPGRVVYLPIWPLAQAEIEGARGDLVDHLFDARVPIIRDAPVGRHAYTERIAAGGYPDAYRRTSRLRTSFFRSYVDSIVGNDVRDVARLRDDGAIGRLLRTIARRSGTLLNLSGLAQDLGVDHKTAGHHLEILQDLFLVRVHVPWRASSTGLRDVKSPKVYLADTGMLTALVGVDAGALDRDDDLAGRTFETFVAMELTKLAGWSEARPTLLHLRDRDRHEVDIVLERPDGDIVGVEVKGSATVTAGDFRGLAYLRDRSSSRFRAGVLMYAGAATAPFGDRLWAVPISSLWTDSSIPRPRDL
jgi:uncharacterized protein